MNMRNYYEPRSCCDSELSMSRDLASYSRISNLMDEARLVDHCYHDVDGNQATFKRILNPITNADRAGTAGQRFDAKEKLASSDSSE
jgi:hypothetical protein